jgi:hypothetical protein
MKNFSKRLLFAACVLIGGQSRADVLKLKQGGGVQGLLVSANSSEITFQGLDGTSKTYPVASVAGIDFASLPPAAPKAASVPTLPAGTQFTVQTIDAVDGKTAKAGSTYRASIGEAVKLGSQTVIPVGATCTIEVVSVDSGKSLGLRVKEINVAGKAYSTSTEFVSVAATGTSKKKKAVRRGVGLGAAGAGIGALAGGGSGAAIGAVVGAGVGAISAAGAKGKDLNVPAESRLLFALKAPVPMN